MSYSVEANNLSKRYVLGETQIESSLRDAISAWIRRPFGKVRNHADEIWALRDVSFQIKTGEVVGIIGRNGAGKSTLLKLLSKITYPSQGAIRSVGRSAALLEVGTGFHSELTGRENIYLNGSILGMKKSEIDLKFDEIVDFAGVAKFIDTPIKRYSSGMELRLGFAVAAHLDVDVMFVDEILAVGDSEFQKKCLQSMGDMRSGGRTVLFVSHNMAAIENLCSRAIWIDGGRVIRDGETMSVIADYLATFTDVNNSGCDLRTFENRQGSGEIRFTDIEILNGANDSGSVGAIFSGDAIVVRLGYEVNEIVSHPHFGVEIYTDMGTLVTSVNTWSSGYEVLADRNGDGVIEVEIDSLNLMAGRYFISLWAASVGSKHYDRLDYCATFDIEASDFYGSGRGMDKRFGIVLLPGKWRSHEKAALTV